VNSGARIRLAGTGFADELGTGDEMQATTKIATPTSQPSLMKQEYRQRSTHRNIERSRIFTRRSWARIAMCVADAWKSWSQEPSWRIA
jgi:hypothetical protein